jgi:hypothetical protein
MAVGVGQHLVIQAGCATQVPGGHRHPGHGLQNRACIEGGSVDVLDRGAEKVNFLEVLHGFPSTAGRLKPQVTIPLQHRGF